MRYIWRQRMQATTSMSVTRREAAARQQVEERGLQRPAQNFVRAMMFNYTLRPRGGIPWRDYEELSEFFDAIGHDCKLPRIEGLHLYLRKEYARLSRRLPRLTPPVAINTVTTAPAVATGDVELEAIMNAVDWDRLEVDLRNEPASQAF